MFEPQCHKSARNKQSKNVLLNSVNYFRDVSEVEKVVDLCGGGKHVCGDEVIDLNGCLGHDVSQWLHIFIKVLQLLVDHRTKNTFDLTCLNGKTYIRQMLMVCIISHYLRERHVNEVEPALQSPGDDHSAPSRGAHSCQQKHTLQQTTDQEVCYVYVYNAVKL